MTISSNYRDFFRDATIEDKLNLFQALLDGKEELTVDLALALLKSIHRELSSNHNHNHLAYKQYASAIELLRYEMSDMLRQVVAAWNLHHTGMPSEWFPNGEDK